MVLSKNFGLFVAGASLFAQGAQAQSLRDLHSEARIDTRASASLTIPLGAKARSDATKPRFDFVLETQSRGHSRSVTPLRFDANFQRQRVRAAKVSFTLEQNPRLLLNDQRVATFGPRLTADEDEKSGGLGTGGWILVGVGVAIGGGFLISEVVKEDLEDAFGIDD